MKAYLRFAASRPIINLILMLCFTVLMAAGLGKLGVRNNQDAELPATDPIVLTKEKIDTVFGDKSAVIIGVAASNIYQPDVLAVIENITEEVKNVPYVIRDDVDSLFTVNNIKSDDWGLTIDSFVNHKNIATATPAQLQQNVDANELVSGRLVNREGTFTTIVANVEEGFDQAVVHSKVNEIVAKYKTDEITFYLSGDPIFRQDIDSGIQQDVGIFMPLALLLVCVMILVFFRSLRAVGLTVLVIVLSIVWTLGFMGWTGLPMTVVSSALPPLLVVLGGSYCIHFLLVYYQVSQGHSRQTNKSQLMNGVIEKLYGPLMLVGFTSAFGAFTLVAFQIVSIREFAVVVAVGVLFTIFLTLASMTSILALLPVQQREIGHRSGWLGKFIHALTSASIRYPKVVLALSGVLLLVSVAGISRIGLGVDIVSLFPQEHKGRQAFEKINDSLGGARFMNIMIDTGKEGGVKDLALLNVVNDYQTYAESLPGVSHADSFVDVLKKLNKEVAEQGEFTLPTQQDLLAQYLFLYDISGEPGDFADVIDYRYQSLKVQLMIESSSPDEHRNIYLQSKAFLDANLPAGAKAEFGGDVIFWVAQNDYIAKGKVLNVISCIVLVTFILIGAFRSARLGLIGIFPIALGAIATFGVLGWFNMRLDFPTSIITGVSVGIGIDFAVHYIAKIRQQAGDNINSQNILQVSDFAGKAIVIDAMSNVIGFLVLTLSGFTAVSNFGWLVTFGMILMALATLTLVPACLTFWPAKQAATASDVAKPLQTA